METVHESEFEVGPPDRILQVVATCVLSETVKLTNCERGSDRCNPCTSRRPATSPIRVLSASRLACIVHNSCLI